MTNSVDTSDIALLNLDKMQKIYDIEMPLTVHLGKCRMRIEDILKIHKGSILEFNQSTDKPLDIYVNDQLVARGKALVKDERYSVEITEIMMMPVRKPV